MSAEIRRMRYLRVRGSVGCMRGCFKKRTQQACQAGAVIALLLMTSGCSYVTNVMAGLSTPQATISGSNYVFVVDPASGNIGATLPPNTLSENISANDSFVVRLDFSFLRYLQAVDPYVVVYSEAWMGAEPPPTKSEDKLRQIVLIKEGLGQNGRLPVTDYPLLGPVNLGDDLLPVTVTVKVVVLSKEDNKQTIALIEQIAGLAGTAAPQYKLAADAAGKVGAAVVALNRDKIEFEQTVTFWPQSQPVSRQPSPSETLSGAPTPVSTTHVATDLRVGQLAILKGENENRVVPYESWYYYILPVNWLGYGTDGKSRRFESKPAWLRRPHCSWEEEGAFCPLDWLSYIPAFIVRLPFYTLQGIFVGGDWSAGPTGIPEACDEALGGGVSAENTCLGVVGHHLMFKKCDSYLTSPMKPNVGLAECNFDWKTYVVLSVARTEGSYGTFSDLLSKFAKHGQVIDDITTSRDEWESAASPRIDAAFKGVRDAVVFDREKRQIVKNSDEGNIQNQDNFKSTGLDAPVRSDLMDIAIAKAKSNTIKDVVRATQEGGTACATLKAKQSQWEPDTGDADFDGRWQRGCEGMISELKRLLGSDALSCSGVPDIAHFCSAGPAPAGG